MVAIEAGNKDLSASHHVHWHRCLAFGGREIKRITSVFDQGSNQISFVSCIIWRLLLGARQASPFRPLGEERTTIVHTQGARRMYREYVSIQIGLAVIVVEDRRRSLSPTLQDSYVVVLAIQWFPFDSFGVGIQVFFSICNKITQLKLKGDPL